MQNTMDASIGDIRDRLYKQYSRAEAYILTNEMERVLRNNGTFEDYMGGDRVSSILKRGDYIGDLRQIFSTQKAAQAEYLRNVRAIVKEYGMQGTELDPDFVGPIPTKKTTPTTPTTQNTWTPLKGSAKVVKESYDEIANEIENSLDAIFDQILEDFDNNNKQIDNQE